ncbi:hypothetical protein WDW89_24225 [Deltaproteobacteria bacterium TL4]
MTARIIKVNNDDIDLNTAMNSFLKKGGKITVLPPQVAVNRTVIGAEQWEAYESIDDLDVANH